MGGTMIGETISHYQILEKLGEGGMGVAAAVFDLDIPMQPLRQN